jgi:hypothetical protein
MEPGMKTVFSLLLLAAPLAAQAPPGWKVRADDPKADMAKLSFEEMKPGFHVTTGPAVILWNPENTATGNFTIEAEIFFFREGSRDTEAYGILLGGKDLDGAADYVYFMLRNDGKYLVKHRAGNGDTHVISDWSANPAVAVHTGSGGPTVKNVISVAAVTDSVKFSVNGKPVASYPRSHMKPEGIVGVRVNHGLNLHVSKLTVTKS